MERRGEYGPNCVWCFFHTRRSPLYSCRLLLPACLLSFSLSLFLSFSLFFSLSQKSVFLSFSVSFGVDSKELPVPPAIQKPQLLCVEVHKARSLGDRHHGDPIISRSFIQPPLNVNGHRVGAFVKHGKPRPVEEEPRHPQPLLLAQRQHILPIHALRAQAPPRTQVPQPHVLEKAFQGAIQ